MFSFLNPYLSAIKIGVFGLAVGAILTTVGLFYHHYTKMEKELADTQLELTTTQNDLVHAVGAAAANAAAVTRAQHEGQAQIDAIQEVAAQQLIQAQSEGELDAVLSTVPDSEDVALPKALSDAFIKRFGAPK